MSRYSTSNEINAITNYFKSRSVMPLSSCKGGIHCALIEYRIQARIQIYTKQSFNKWNMNIKASTFVRESFTPLVFSRLSLFPPAFRQEFVTFYR